jgi:predicted small lipoprotein YifL
MLAFRVMEHSPDTRQHRPARRRLLLVGLISLLAAACGRRGDLELPEDETADRPERAGSSQR